MANTITAKEMKTKSPSEKRRSIQGLSVLKYGLAAFAALAGEAVIAYGIEQNIYGIHTLFIVLYTEADHDKIPLMQQLLWH